jgi:hypothetical protein
MRGDETQAFPTEVKPDTSTIRAIPAQERGETYNMKYLAILTLTLAALGLGACHHDAPAQSTTSSHSTHTYSPK